jgi:tetratricopeptide (TPR) repeat protein
METPPKDPDILLFDMSKANLGTITSDEDKKRYLYTIQLEKSRLTRKMLKGVYDNAFDLYKKGEYSGSKELTSKVLAIDPSYEDAAVLQRAAIELDGQPNPHFSQNKLIEDKFEEGLELYRQGRLVEAAARWEEATKLAPSNLKAAYWLKKCRGQLASDHFARGQRAYRQHRLGEALDQWYAALVLNPRYPRLPQAIAKVESEQREGEANERLQQALSLYSQGETAQALKILDSILQVGPGNAKAQRLMAEIRAEMAQQHVAAGRDLYEKRRYMEAIAEWKEAVNYGYDPRASDQLIARAKEQMKREDEARRHEAEMAQQRQDQVKKQAEEEKKKAEEEAKKKEADAKAAASTSAAPAPAPAAVSAPATPGVVTEESRKQSQQHYLSGVIFFQKGDYEKSREEWTLAKQLDPSNSDAAAGLDRIDKLYGSGP